ncbi:hypothetical protein AB205_0059380, partial [Aquarana catesbeiana]
KCIPRRLKCNGDDDCGDSSDEKNCNSIRSPCTDRMEQYWAIENLASGLNLLTNLREGLVLDHRYYGGGCAPHYILGTRFRKPFNVESYITDTKGKYEFTLSGHESFSDYERNYLSALGKQRSFGIGIFIPGVFEFGFNYGKMKFKKYVERTKSFSHTASSGDPAMAKYKLKSRGVMLHSDFFQRVKQLPMEYVYGEYRDLFRDYGTHYVTEATLGGVYEYTLILNKDHVKSEDPTENRKIVEDFVVLLRGGSSEHVATLAYRNLPTPDLMQEWGDAVQYSPEIINIKTNPLYELVTTTDFIGANVLQENMKRALEEFERETASCRCAPCENNGVAFFKEHYSGERIAVNVFVQMGLKGQLVKSPKGQFPPLMEFGVVGPVGRHVPEESKQDNDSAITLHRGTEVGLVQMHPRRAEAVSCPPYWERMAFLPLFSPGNPA